MSTPFNVPTVIFLGGPNDGFIEVGEAAAYAAFNFDVPASGEQQGSPTPAAIGRRIRTMPKYLWDAGQKLGMEKAHELLSRYGKAPTSGAVYELTETGAVFVYRYVGEHGDVYADKGKSAGRDKTDPATEETDEERHRREMRESDDPDIWTKIG